MRRSGIRFFIASTILLSFLPINVRAADLTTLSDTLSTIKQSVVANHTLQFTINDSWDASDTVTVDFPDTFSASGFANNEPEDYDITDDGADKSIVANGSCVADSIEVTTVNTSTITFTFTLCAGSAAIASGSVVTVEIGTNATFGAAGNDQMTNQTAAQNDSDGLVTIAGTFGGAGTLGLEIVADNDATVNATVDPRITCTFGGMTTTFTALTGPVATSNTNTTVTISTNAPNGFALTVRDDGNGINPGLYKSTAPTYLIGSADGSPTFSDTATLTNDVDGFGIQGSTSGGSGAAVTIAARYNQSGNTVGGLELSATSLASAAGPVASRIVTVVHKAAVSGLAPAGTYNDTLTYVCTGVF